MSFSHSPITKIRTGCPAHNCGGRCLLIAHIEDEKIVRLDTDDRPDTLAAPQLRACARGRAYLRRQYHPDRLLYPLKRVGKRGEGKFVRVSWDEALGEVASQMVRIKSEYGNDALFVPYGTGSYNQLNGSHVARRLMNLFGGCLGIYNSYSWGAINIATPTVYGTLVTGNQRQDWLNSKYILMWGWNPAEMRDGTNSDYFVKLARENGARVVCIDPRHSLSAAALADEWIPIRPGADAAMMSAMAYVMLTENLHDAEFVRTHCVGFDASQMPVEGAESYSEYLLGARDGQPKTPEWAEAITAVPAATIARIAREYATSKPAVSYQGYGMQRRAYGEQVVRAGCVLAAISGNVGISGGWASGLGLQAEDGGPHWTVFPLGENPVRASIPVFLWTEACLRGKEFAQADGLVGVPRLTNDIKLIYAVATNCLINQHADVNRSAEILRDESKVEFIIVQDNFLTPTGMFADIILPACTQFETWGVEDGWKYSDEVILQPKLVEPPGEAKSDYRICADLAERLEIAEAFTEGRDEKDWVEYCLQVFRSTRFPELPTLDEFIEKNLGAWSKPVTNPKIAFADFRGDPEKYPLATPSGKIEIFSKKLHDMGNPEEIPAVPKYIQEWENPFTTETTKSTEKKQEKNSVREASVPSVVKKYPLQAIGHHTLARVHSTHANNDWLQEAFPQRVFINPIDAAARDIYDGDLVRVWNGLGEMVIQARVTPRIMPGVVDIPQGAWWQPDENGVDHGGNVNVLTSHKWTPLAFGSAQQTIWVEMEKATEDEGRKTDAEKRSSWSSVFGPWSEIKITYTFTFDASACSGCKACQEACKDKNNLPVGVLWRRVVEVSGGEWVAQNGAWENSVFAYNLSIACNHCEHPKCAGVCPTDAYIHREDGIVYIDSSKCMGCGYCAWACPYNAPRYDFELGQMSKCNFCFDNIDAGLPPSCVAACPMRVLNFVEVSALPKKHRDDVSEVEGRMLWKIPATEHPFPLPTLSRTEPHLAIKPHRAMNNSLEKVIGNSEEIRPKRRKSEASLVAFTLLAQMSVGMAWAGLWMTDSLPLIPYLLIGMCLGVGGFFSFAHLGAKRNAWRAPFHLKKSWLSREILTAGLFGASWLAEMFVPEIKWVTALLGVALVYSMAKVYRLHVMPAWDTWRTTAGFFITAALLGQSMMNILLGGGKSAWGVAAVLLAVELAMMLSGKPKARWTVTNLRVGLILASLGAAILLIASNPPEVWISPVLFLLITVEEIIGRAQFYTALNERPL